MRDARVPWLDLDQLKDAYEGVKALRVTGDSVTVPLTGDPFGERIFMNLSNAENSLKRAIDHIEAQGEANRQAGRTG